MRVTRRCCLSRSPKNRRRFRPSLPHGRLFCQARSCASDSRTDRVRSPLGFEGPCMAAGISANGAQRCRCEYLFSTQGSRLDRREPLRGRRGKGGGAWRGARWSWEAGGKARGLHGWRCSWLTGVSLPLLLISPASRSWQHVLYDTLLPLSRELAVFLWGGG